MEQELSKFINDSEYDPVVIGVGMEWLAQYARFIRRSPELTYKLIERSDEFEVIPIPKALLNRLAIPGLLGSGELGDRDSAVRDLHRWTAASTHKAATNPALLQSAFEQLRKFAIAVEAGDVVRVATLFAPDFLDQDGRGGQEMQNLLGALMARTNERILKLGEISVRHESNRELVLRASVEWIASESKDQRGKRISEELNLEFILELSASGVWLISSLRVV